MIFDGVFVTQRSIRVEEYDVVLVGSSISWFSPKYIIQFSSIADVTPGVRSTFMSPSKK